MTAKAAIEAHFSVNALDDGIDAAIDWLEQQQQAEGFWSGVLESNCCMEAEWLLLFHILGIAHPKTSAIVRTIVNQQRDDGAWEIYYQAPGGDINTTVECYAALRSTGMSPNDPILARAREWILAHGGLQNIRVFTRYWLALIGEWPWQRTPNLPPEIIYFPKWFPFNIYRFASWARATILPISVLAALQPVRPLQEEHRLHELFPEGRDNTNYALPKRGNRWSLPQFFLLTDKLLHAYQRLGWKPGRKAALGHCLEWIIRHQDADGAWGGIQPPWIYSLMAVHFAGYPLSHPVLAQGLAALDAHWSCERDGGLHIQASESPVWDTLLAVLAMQDCGVSYRNSSAMHRAVNWLLSQQVRVPGDWSEKMENVTPSGWAFERANNFYPDLDDTAVAVIVLSRLCSESGRPARMQAAIDRAVDWMLAMQCKDGGWAAFDKDNDRNLLTQIPFCDFGETLDPASVDVTAHVLEALGRVEFSLTHPAVKLALRCIRAEQEPEGSWFGRWGVNHIYGTAAVLPALHSIGEDLRAPYVRKAVRWLADRQNSDGGWGESCASYMDDGLRGKGPSTASQTAWALLALLATEDRQWHAAISRGVNYLVANQVNGTWDEPYYTGTGFPGYGIGIRAHSDDENKMLQSTELQRGFMINYNLYRHYFPLMALGRAKQYFLPNH